jgi:KaiC/GvpD/RAD55 family RecA-like ATPase
METNYNEVFLKRYWEDDSFKEAFESYWKKDYFDSNEEKILYALLHGFKRVKKEKPLKNDLILEVETKSKYESIRKSLLEVIERVDEVDLSKYSPDILQAQFEDISKKKQAQTFVQELVEQVNATGRIDYEKIKTSYESMLSTERLNGGNTHSPFTTKLSDITKRQRKWLWENYLPVGDATLISGDPDTGKTWVALYFASVVSKGKAFPNGFSLGRPNNVMYLSTEDEADVTIKSRVQQLKGDEDRFFVYHGEEKKEMLDLGSDPGLKRLETEIKRIGGISLLIIDPIIDFSPRTNPNKNEEVRKLLEPLIDMSRKMEFALIILSHLNKNQTENAIYRAAGSAGGWLGKCRAAFLVVNDVDEEENHFFHKVKANNAYPQPKDFGFKITERGLVATMCEERIDINHHLNTNDKKPREKENAVEWIYRQFENTDEIASLELEQMAIDAGISLKTFQRARECAGCVSKRKKVGDAFRYFTSKPSVERKDKENVLEGLDVL